MRRLLKTEANSDYYNSTFRLRKYFAISTLSLSLLHVTFRLFQMASNGGHNWGTGEWLINYSGGFIRRGMIGSILLFAAQDGPNVLFIIFAVQMSLIIIIFAFFFFCLKKFDFTWASIALFCSPFSITFIGWDQYVFARKELIGLATLVLIASVDLFKPKREIYVIGLAMLLFTIGVFSSEVNMVLIPAVIYLLSRVYSNHARRKFWIATTVFSLVTFAAFLTSIIFSGSKRQAKEICQKVVDSGLIPNQNCNGSIQMMGESPREFFSLLVNAFPQYLAYLPILVLAFLPILSAGWHRKYRFWFLVVCLSTGSLFLLALDYGRNIFIMTSALTICIATTMSNLKVQWNPWSAIIYVTLIGMGHGGNPITNGWIAALPSTIRIAKQYVFN